ncbi:VOC family protein [Mycobacterium sp. NPDC006124]|uniref:VOC family protein n=1 Tax=Mycobacterium sp. NPDC006124 TaxID=3156729 RepID=UPI0033A36961
MEILASRVLFRPADYRRSLAFYRDDIGLAIAREYGAGTVFYAGQSLIELAGHGGQERSDPGNGHGGQERSNPGNGHGGQERSNPGNGHGGQRSAGAGALWLQVRDVYASQAELEGRGVTIARAATEEPWGLHEMHVIDPDGVTLIFVQIPSTHPLRRDVRN